MPTSVRSGGYGFGDGTSVDRPIALTVEEVVVGEGEEERSDDEASSSALSSTAQEEASTAATAASTTVDGGATASVTARTDGTSATSSSTAEGTVATFCETATNDGQGGGEEEEDDDDVASSEAVAHRSARTSTTPYRPNCSAQVGSSSSATGAAGSTEEKCSGDGDDEDKDNDAPSDRGDTAAHRLGGVHRGNVPRRSSTSSNETEENVEAAAEKARALLLKLHQQEEEEKERQRQMMTTTTEATSSAACPAANVENKKMNEESSGGPPSSSGLAAAALAPPAAEVEAGAAQQNKSFSENSNRDASKCVAATTDVQAEENGVASQRQHDGDDDFLAVASGSGSDIVAGGRLWKLAGDEAAGTATGASHPAAPNSKQQRLIDTFMERMRSRADPDAVVVQPHSTPQQQQQQKPDDQHTPEENSQVNMLRQHRIIVDKQDEAFLMNTGLARKRVRVVQLLVIGLVGLMLGWLGNFFVGTSCYFGSSEVQVGANGDILSLHFGLWKYSPVDAAVTGYRYCYPYSSSSFAAKDAPIVARTFNLLALALGTYSQVVLWLYLIAGIAVRKHWTAAVYAAYAAGVCQASTLLFFVGTLCRSRTCQIGSAGILAIVTALAWCVFAWEMHYNRPLASLDAPPDDVDRTSRVPTAPCSDKTSMTTESNKQGVINHALDDSAESSVGVSSLEMADFKDASKEYIERFHRSSSSSPRGSYQPPELT